MTWFRRYLGLAVLLLSPAAAPAFNGHQATTGPLSISIAAVPVVQAYDVPQPCSVSLANSGSATLEVTLALIGLVDDCAAVGDAIRRVAVPARGSASAVFQFRCGRGTFSAHYPVQVEASFEADGSRQSVRAVQIFETRFLPDPLAAADPPRPPVTRVPSSGALALGLLKFHGVAWSYHDGPLVRLPIGWTGSDATSSASFARAPIARGDIIRNALQLHPPYRPRAGTVFAEYRLQLPATTPLRLEFFHAIRDSSPREGQSDGVTFRVWVDGTLAFERHSDARTWVPGAADLSAWAGKEILLRLESHPGPRNNTTCDSSYWGDPVIVVGPSPRILNDVERAALAARTRQLLQAAKPDAATEFAFALEGGCRAALVLGPNGLADGVIGFGDAARQLQFAGLHLAVQDHPLGAWPSAVIVQSVTVHRESTGRTRIVHQLALENRTVDLTATVWADGPALRIKVECPDPISGLGLNPADQRAPRVYYGHGYCIVDPQPFRASPGGHNLSTSHVGFDFEGGVSLLTASDTPVDFLQVDPARRLYQLQTHPDATLTLVPGFAGALDCAVRYRPYYDKSAAPGVANKAGRFVFDLWGGRYADDAAKLARCFDYGLTDALVLMHVWQRWGYDYRLPDIFPPLPALGSLADLQALGRLCTARGVRWGLHDNYIDLYPDAAGFSYDHITFSADGKPRRAWLNESREAQSYQFRPDRIRPFLQRNLDLIVPALQPTASFVDVFASLQVFDFHDRAGNFHSKRETQRAWGEAFALIRDACGGNAPTISEAGSDQLIGWLDGADAQFIQLSSSPAPFHNVVRCADWERVPWFDAVNHARFSLHGVGYSDRYQGGRSREEHGIESDDYLSAELLTGHALMIDLPGLGRGAVRKYWLAQDFIASVARDDIRAVEFAAGDIHRATVTWNSGARVHVNRGTADWTIDGHTLPPFGFHARHGALESSVERWGPLVAEQSRAPGRYYFNGRGFNPAAPLAITPRADRVEHLGDRRFRLVVSWDARQPAPRDCQVFYHFSRPTPGRRAPTEFFGGGAPRLPTSEWRGEILTGGDWTITMPADLPAGEYEILVGLHDPKNRGARERLLGDEDARRRYRIGKLVVTDGGKVGNPDIRLIPSAAPSTAWEATPANASPVDFGPVETTGGLRCTVAADHLELTPLPDGPEFEVRLRLRALLGRDVVVTSVDAVAVGGGNRQPAPFSARDGELTFRTAKSAFAYRINFR